MKSIKTLFVVLIALGLTACAQPDPAYSGPEVTSIVLLKGERRLHLLHGNTALRTYDVELGSQPIGQKGEEGDGRTPEGVYFIDRHNPNSQYHRSLGLSYPNRTDRARAASKGVAPGGDIFIHGTPTVVFGKPDWTAGCIAVTNEEVDEIYGMVKGGTPIFIYP